MPQFKFALSHVAKDENTDDVGKTALLPPKSERREVSMDLIVMSGWKSEDYSAPAKESVSLVGKSMGLPKTTSGGFALHTPRVGQMELETPP